MERRLEQIKYVSWTILFSFIFTSSPHKYIQLFCCFNCSSPILAMRSFLMLLICIYFNFICSRFIIWQRELIHTLSINLLYINDSKCPNKSDQSLDIILIQVVNCFKPLSLLILGASTIMAINNGRRTP